VATLPCRPTHFRWPQAIRTLEDRIHEAPQRAANYARWAICICSEANWLSKAIGSYEAASDLAPGAAYRWRLVDLYLNASRVEKMLAQLKYLSEHAPADTQTGSGIVTTRTSTGSAATLPPEL